MLIFGKPVPFSHDACIAAGLTGDPALNHYRVPLFPGWFVYNSGRSDYPWGYAHMDDGRDYGEVETLEIALAAIRDNG